VGAGQGWTPVTPCTGLYLPVFVASNRLPEILSTAGTQGKTVTPPPQAKQDEFAENSYWWLFRDLLDKIKGDETGTEFGKRQSIARAAFNELEEKWMEQSKIVEKQAVAQQASSKLLDDFTQSCVKEAVATVNKLRKA